MADAEMIMVAPAEVAARDGVTKQAVTKLVRRLVEEHGLPVERDGRDRITRFSLAHYDHLRGEFASSAKAAAARETEEPSARPAAVVPGTSRDEALRQEAWLKVGREKLRRQEEAGQLVRADRYQTALMMVGQEIKAEIARLPNKADDLALAVSREGVHGLRSLLRTVAFEMSERIADRLARIGADAAEFDEPIEVDEL